MGRGFSGTTIKDTRTKSRQRVEVGDGGGIGWSGVEGRGENADNCIPYDLTFNWNIINKRKKANKI